MIKIMKAYYLHNITKFKLLLEKYSGKTWEDFLDCFFLATIFLVLFKLLFRLVFGINSYWYINIIIFFFGFLVQYKFENILFKINEIFVKVTKPLLGKTYWNKLDYANLDLIELCPTEQPIDDIDITKGNIINKIFREFCIFLILLRLLTFKNPYLFIFFNFILTYFLLLNNYLILTSLVSVILLLSRMLIFITDFNKTHFFRTIYRIEKIESDEYIALTKLNAIIVLLWSIRSYHTRSYMKEYKEKIKNDKMYKITGSYPSFLGDSDYYLKIKQLPIEVLTNLEEKYPGLTDIVRFSLRLAICNDEGREYKDEDRILKIKKKKYTFDKLLAVGAGGTVVSKDSTNVVIQPIKNNLFEPLSNFISDFFYKKEPRKQEFLDKVIEYKDDNVLAKNHPVNYKVTEDTVFRITESSIRKNVPRPGLAKLGDLNSPKFGNLQLCRSINIKDQKKVQEIKRTLQENEVEYKIFDRDFVPMRIAVHNNLNFPDILNFEIEQQTYRSFIFQPDCVSISSQIWRNPYASKAQAIRGNEECIHFHNNLAHNPYISQFQKDLHCARVKQLQDIRLAIENLIFLVSENDEDKLVEIHLNNLTLMNRNLQNIYPATDFVNAIISPLTTTFNISRENAMRHIYNMEHIKKEFREKYSNQINAGESINRVNGLSDLD